MEEDANAPFDYVIQDIENQPPPYAKQPEELTKWQLDSFQLLDNLRHDLRGDIWDFEKAKWEEDKEDFTVNEYGVKRIISMLRPKIDKIVVLSNFSEEEVYSVVKEFNFVLIRYMLQNFEAFGIKKSDLSMVVNKIMDVIFSAYMRAKGEGERKFLRTTEKRIEHIRPPQIREKGTGWIPFRS